MENLAQKLKDLAVSRGVTVGTAESCTGGLVSGEITSVPGSSDYFLGAVVSYANEIKNAELGVDASVLESCGAVSSECAALMAAGVQNSLGVDYAISVTGVAGPGGGSPEKPVGTVWFGLCGPYGVWTERCFFDGDRASVRRQSVEKALSMLVEALEDDR